MLVYICSGGIIGCKLSTTPIRSSLLLRESRSRSLVNMMNIVFGLMSDIVKGSIIIMCVSVVSPKSNLFIDWKTIYMLACMKVQGPVVVTRTVGWAWALAFNFKVLLQSFCM